MCCCDSNPSWFFTNSARQIPGPKFAYKTRFRTFFSFLSSRRCRRHTGSVTRSTPHRYRRRFRIERLPTKHNVRSVVFDASLDIFLISSSLHVYTARVLFLFSYRPCAYAIKPQITTLFVTRLVVAYDCETRESTTIKIKIIIIKQFSSSSLFLCFVYTAVSSSRRFCWEIIT